MICKLPPTLWSYFAGFWYALSWLILIDAQIYELVVRKQGGYTQEMNFIQWIPVFLATPGWILLSIIPSNYLRDDPDNPGVVIKARVVMFFAFLLLFVSITVGAIIMIVMLTNVSNTYQWGHISSLLHPIFVTFSALLFFFGKLIGHKIKCGNE